MVGIALVAGLALGHEPVKAQATSYLIDVSVFQGDPLGSRAEGNVKWLTEARVVVQAGRPAFFRSGGEVPVAGGGMFPVGVSIQLNPLAGPDGTILVYAEFSQTTTTGGPAVQVGEKFVPAHTEQALRTTLKIKPGEKTRQRIAARSATDQTWAEVTVRTVE